MSDAIRQLWAAQEREAAPPPQDELRKRARRLHRQLKVRNRLEYAAGAIAGAAFAYFAFVAPTIWIGLGCLAVIAGMAAALVNVHRHRGRGPETSPDFVLDCRTFLRAELVRQRDALASVWRWYLLPMDVGLALFLASVWLYGAGSIGAAEATRKLVPVLAVIIGISALVYWMNRRAARDLQQEIDAIEGEAGSGGGRDEG